MSESVFDQLSLPSTANPKLDPVQDPKSLSSQSTSASASSSPALLSHQQSALQKSRSVASFQTTPPTLANGLAAMANSNMKPSSAALQNAASNSGGNATSSPQVKASTLKGRPQSKVTPTRSNGVSVSSAIASSAPTPVAAGNATSTATATSNAAHAGSLTSVSPLNAALRANGVAGQSVAGDVSVNSAANPVGNVQINQFGMSLPNSTTASGLAQLRGVASYPIGSQPAARVINAMSPNVGAAGLTMARPPAAQKSLSGLMNPALAGVSAQSYNMHTLQNLQQELQNINRTLSTTTDLNEARELKLKKAQIESCFQASPAQAQVNAAQIQAQASFADP
ncbi:uncharacterized protein BJ171DRAFT_248395 [Polychytrium aggregatum]|uniref:uncharacterized protein n=1 Tax=Polychytrium aggregatum TaxID=110093 RepID=UPI0022FDF42C|nr:uncharacterized protein BJ171DRAFT_248395 [Polychytrium aggregatum]KAI9193699.1 hypothetical protein BJ171DRAFT_248395 [Polychytrium aggregatum]